MKKPDQQFRKYTSMEWSFDWKKISPADITERITGRDVRQSVLRHIAAIRGQADTLSVGT